MIRSVIDIELNVSIVEIILNIKKANVLDANFLSKHKFVQ